MIFKNDQVLAFLDIYPISKGHALVLPITHVEYFSELPFELSQAVMIASVKVARAIKSATKCEGLNILLADGKVAGQEVPHVHMYIIPRYKDDGLRFVHSTKHPGQAHRAELDEIAVSMRQAME